MIKIDLVKKVSEATKLNLRESEVVVNKVFSGLVDLLKRGKRIELRGFGTFGVKGVKAKVGQNLATGESVSLAPYTKPYFKPGRELKPWPLQQVGAPEVTVAPADVGVRAESDAATPAMETPAVEEPVVETVEERQETAGEETKGDGQDELF